MSKAKADNQPPPAKRYPKHALLLSEVGGRKQLRQRRHHHQPSCTLRPPLRYLDSHRKKKPSASYYSAHSTVIHVKAPEMTLDMVEDELRFIGKKEQN
ncbi:hypothetical protein AVEN_174116-1 [Araneus ventricosus]|uniref:Uncharacterized protein n=1 Tax=Araneus ventricosus TaxID=182803 RepID=A0A4Y2C4U1_ARAVE|nr:hypothetical protein AVEN_174116-1 [Araneus ventricosus]